MTTRVDFVRAAEAEIAAEVDGARLEAMRRERRDLPLADVHEPPVVLYYAIGGWCAMWPPP
jgi:hypothetical protein